jgi:hypothetical protein
MLAAVALQGSAVAASPDVSQQISASISSRVSAPSSVSPMEEVEGLAGYFGPIAGANQTVVSTMTVNKTGACTAVNKGVYQEFLTGSDTGASGVVIFSVCIDGATQIAYNNCSSDINEPCAGVPAGKTIAGGDKLNISITDGALNKVKVTNVTKGWTQTEDGPPTNPTLYNIDDQRVLIDDVLVPMPNFKQTLFTGTTIGGKTLKSTAPTKYDMVNETGVRLATTSAIAANGKDWNIKFVKAA